MSAVLATSSSRPRGATLAAAGSPAATRQAPDHLPLEVVDVSPLDKSGAHQFFEGHLGTGGPERFVKHNTVKGLFKSRAAAPINHFVRNMQEAKLPNLDRLQDMSEVVFSNFAKNFCDHNNLPYSGITYQEVFFRDASGKPHVGIAAPMVANLGTLDDVPATSVSNPKQAVFQTLLRGLMLGDWNCTFRDQNVGVAHADTTVSYGDRLDENNVVDLDYGDAGSPHVESEGVPYGNRLLVETFPQYVKPALDVILRTTPADIHTLLLKSTEGVTGWTPQMTAYYESVMTGNLEATKDQLARHPNWIPGASPQDGKATHARSLNPLKWASVGDGFKQFFFRIPAGSGNLAPLKKSGFMQQIESADSLAERLAPFYPRPAQTAVVDSVAPTLPAMPSTLSPRTPDRRRPW